MTTAPKSMFAAELVFPAIRDAVLKLDPRQLVKNPVLLVTAVIALLLTLLLVIGGEPLSTGFQVQLIVWLWLTVLFGTFAEALAEGRGRAQAASLRSTKAELQAKRLTGVGDTWSLVGAQRLERGDVVLVETGDLIPADGEVIEGVASVNEAAITGESAPVIREAGGDRSAVTAGSRRLARLWRLLQRAPLFTARSDQYRQCPPAEARLEFSYRRSSEQDRQGHLWRRKHTAENRQHAVCLHAEGQGDRARCSIGS